MKPTRWIRRRWKQFVKSQVMKSLAYRVLVAGYEDGKPYQNKHGTEDEIAVDGIYTQIPTAYAGIQAIANAVSMVPMRVVDRNGKELANHPLSKLLQEPNDIDTSVDLMEQTMIFLECTGTMPWFLDGPGTRIGLPPERIIPLHPNRVRPILDAKEKISGYVYNVENRSMQLDRNQMLYFRYFDPSDARGVGGIGSARPMLRPATVDLMASKFNQRFFARGAVLSGVIETESEDIEYDTMMKFVEQFRESHAGSDKAWEVRGLTHGLKWKPTQPTHTDMLFEKLRSMNREEMLMTMGVPPVMVTLMDGATYANANQQEYAFWITTILPKLRKLEARINRDLAARYGPNVFVIFDVSAIRALQPDRTGIASVITQMVERRIINPNEGRQYLDTGRMPRLDKVPHGEEFLSNFQITTLEAAEETEPAQLPTEEESEDEIENILRKMEIEARRLDLDQRKESAAKSYASLRRVTERHFSRAAEKMFKEQLKAATEWVDSKAVKQNMAQLDQLLADLEEKHRARFLPLFSEASSEAGRIALALLGADLEYNSGSVNAIAFANAEAGKLVTEANRTTLEKLRVSLTEGLANSETVQELTARVESVLGPDATAARSRNIAITESNKALNFGTLESWDQTEGLVKGKGWLSSGDENVRETHADADGQEVGLHDLFQVGQSQLGYPGDTSHGADVSEVANCRCNMYGVLDEAKRFSRNGHGKLVKQ